MKRINRLKNEKIPCLQLHAKNPIDWHPWGSEALTLARNLQKPIFLCIGYSACHRRHGSPSMKNGDADSGGTASLPGRGSEGRTCWARFRPAGAAEIPALTQKRRSRSRAIWGIKKHQEGSPTVRRTAGFFCRETFARVIPRRRPRPPDCRDRPRRRKRP